MDGYVKLNTDDSSHGNLGPGGGGKVIRDPNGDVMFAFAEYYGSTSFLQAEARAPCTGLEICALKGLSRSGIVVETDSKILWGTLVFVRSFGRSDVLILLLLWSYVVFVKQIWWLIPWQHSRFHLAPPCCLF